MMMTFLSVEEKGRGAPLLHANSNGDSEPVNEASPADLVAQRARRVHCGEPSLALVRQRSVAGCVFGYVWRLLNGPVNDFLDAFLPSRGNLLAVFSDISGIDEGLAFGVAEVFGRHRQAGHTRFVRSVDKSGNAPQCAFGVGE